MEIELTREEFMLFDSYLQYGNLPKANYIFVGREEGLNRENIAENLKKRKEKFQIIPQNMKFIESITGIDGTYYEDDLFAYDLEKYHQKYGPNKTFEDLIANHNFDLTMRYQARVMTYLSSEASLWSNETEMKRKTREYFFYNLHRPSGDTAMIDLYSLPKQGKIKFVCNDAHVSSNRSELLKRIYDVFPMTVSIVYAGKPNGKFLAEDFYENTLGFQFQDYNTGQVNANFVEHVKPSKKPKDFRIGTRTRGDHRQLVFLTPFFGQGQFSYEDIAVISTWIPKYL